MKDNYEKIFKLYGSTHTMEKKKGTAVDLTKLANNESVCACDDKHHWLLTEIGATSLDKIQFLLNKINSDEFECTNKADLRTQLGDAKVAIVSEKDKVFSDLIDKIRNIPTTNSFVSKNKVIQAIKEEKIK